MLLGQKLRLARAARVVRPRRAPHAGRSTASTVLPVPDVADQQAGSSARRARDRRDLAHTRSSIAGAARTAAPRAPCVLGVGRERERAGSSVAAAAARRRCSSPSWSRNSSSATSRRWYGASRRAQPRRARGPTPGQVHLAERAVISAQLELARRVGSGSRPSTQVAGARAAAPTRPAGARVRGGRPSTAGVARHDPRRSSPGLGLGQSTRRQGGAAPSAKR